MFQCLDVKQRGAVDAAEFEGAFRLRDAAGARARAARQRPVGTKALGIAARAAQAVAAEAQ